MEAYLIALFTGRRDREFKSLTPNCKPRSRVRTSDCGSEDESSSLSVYIFGVSPSGKFKEKNFLNLVEVLKFVLRIFDILYQKMKENK